MLTQNRDIIVDSVWALNHGTMAEFGKPEKDRKNYAFYEGYSRLYFDLERPGYSPGKHAGAGIMFRISDNIKLYAANLADTFNMFDSAFLTGSSTNRRIIISAEKDSTLRKIYSDGLWIKGIDKTKGEERYYIGVNAVRLPVKKLSSTVIGIPFAIGSEKKIESDPEGKLVGGVERSIMRVYELSENQNSIDTLRNTSDPGMMLHGQTRRAEFDSSFISLDSVRYIIQAKNVDLNKMHLIDTTKYGITLVDSSSTIENIELLAIKIAKFPVVVFNCIFRSRVIGMRDAFGGELKKNNINPYKVTAIALLKDTTKLPEEKDRGKGVAITFSKDLRIYRSRDTTAQNLLWPHEHDNSYDGKYFYSFTWNDYINNILSIDTLFIKGKNGKVTEYFEIGIVTLDKKGDIIITKAEKAILQFGNKFEIQITIPTDVNDLTYDYWIPNTVNGYNDKWVITVTKNGARLPNEDIVLQYAEGYENYNQGANQPVFMDTSGTVIDSIVTSDNNGQINHVRFGFNNNTSGRVGDVYKLRARVKSEEIWFETKEKDFLGVYDKKMLDVAKTYCNNPAIADWNGKDREANDPPVIITDAVAYSYGGKDALDHFNDDMVDWMGVMDSCVKVAAKVNDSMHKWKNVTDALYNNLFPDTLTDSIVFYQRMVKWRDTLYSKLNQFYPNPDPVALFNDDMIEWKGKIDSVFAGMPSGPSSNNIVKRDSLRNVLNGKFANLFPTNIPRSWTVTTAKNGVFKNYRIDNRGNLNTTQTIMSNCYTTRRNVSGNEHKYAAGIDCSGFLQRSLRPSATSGNMRLPYLGDRCTWTRYTVGEARSCAMIINGVGGVTYSELIGEYGNNAKKITFHRLVPGDIIVRAGVPNAGDHVAIINFITGERGNKNLTDVNARGPSKILLIQAIGGEDKPTSDGKTLGGRTTDTWRWDTMKKPETYNARRILP